MGGPGGLFPDHDIVNHGNNYKYDKPWSNTQTFVDARQSFLKARGRWNWTWVGDDAAMQVEYVKVYQRSNRGTSGSPGLCYSTLILLVVTVILMHLN